MENFADKRWTRKIDKRRSIKNQGRMIIRNLPLKQTTSTIEDGEITLQVSEEDMSIISTDKSEENQPILINDEDKPANTSTPKRKSKDELGATTKKLIVENIDILTNGSKNIKTLDSDDGDEGEWSTK